MSESKVQVKFIVSMILSLILFSKSSISIAQDLSITADTIIWEVDQFTDRNAQVTDAFACKFITAPLTITWLQKNGELSTQFTISGTSGQWPDLEADGSMEFQVHIQDRSGTITFRRSASGVEIQLSFVQGGQDTMPLTFHVTRYAKQ